MKSPDPLKGTRHYHVSHHFARAFADLVNSLPTALMRADGLTKPMGRTGHVAILETVPGKGVKDKAEAMDED